MTANERDKAIELAKDFIKYKSYSSTVLTVSEVFLSECNAREEAEKDNRGYKFDKQFLLEELKAAKEMLGGDAKWVSSMAQYSRLKIDNQKCPTCETGSICVWKEYSVCSKCYEVDQSDR